MPHYGPEVDSASKRNEYQGSSLGGKDGWYVGADNFATLMCHLFKNPDSLKLMEPSVSL